MQLIASDRLHRTDYVAQKKAGVASNFFISIRLTVQGVDSEVDAYLMEHLVNAKNTDADQDKYSIHMYIILSGKS